MKLRPSDWFTVKYWLHLVIISIIILGLLQVFKGDDMLTLKNILWSIPLVGVADIMAHSVLGID